MTMTLTLPQAAGFFLQLARGLTPATHNMLAYAGDVIEQEAKRLIGTYDYRPRWPELAEATKKERVEQGFPENEPGLRTGEMRDSIHHVVVGNTVHIGSDDDKLVWFELGTVKQPPRPVLAAAVNNVADRLTHELGKRVQAYLSSGKFPSDSGHPFNQTGQVIR